MNINNMDLGFRELWKIQIINDDNFIKLEFCNLRPIEILTKILKFNEKFILF